jgi:hypothetical protein
MMTETRSCRVRKPENQLGYHHIARIHQRPGPQTHLSILAAKLVDPFQHLGDRSGLSDQHQESLSIQRCVENEHGRCFSRRTAVEVELLDRRTVR